MILVDFSVRGLIMSCSDTSKTRYKEMKMYWITTLLFFSQMTGIPINIKYLKIHVFFFTVTSRNILSHFSQEITPHRKQVTYIEFCKGEGAKLPLLYESFSWNQSFVAEFRKCTQSHLCIPVCILQALAGPKDIHSCLLR